MHKEINDCIGFTQLDTLEPAAEFHKKKESRFTKKFTYWVKKSAFFMYIDLDNTFCHSFAYEIQQAALQLLVSGF